MIPNWMNERDNELEYTPINKYAKVFGREVGDQLDFAIQ